MTRGAADEKRTGKTDWTLVEALTGEQALQNALADEENPPLTDEQLARMRRVPNPQEIRQRLGLTQREFATQFQIALGTLRDWEQGAQTRQCGKSLLAGDRGRSRCRAPDPADGG